MLHKVDEEIVIEKYEEGLSGIQIGKDLNIKTYQVHYILDKHGVKKRKNGQNWKKYTAKYDFFETIDTEEKAYWLGFIAADGYVTNRNQIGITLSTKDRSHLEKFKKAISSTHKIYNYVYDTTYKKDTEYSRILITSDKMKKDLVSKGILEQKTFLLEFPVTESNLIKDYIRGYIDGDGSISKTLSDSGLLYEYQLKVMGRKDFLQGILKFLKQEHQTLFKRHDDETDNYYFSIGGNIQVEKVLDLIYGNANIYLNRKYQRYLDLKAQSSEGEIPQSTTS